MKDSLWRASRARRVDDIGIFEGCNGEIEIIATNPGIETVDINDFHIVSGELLSERVMRAVR